MSQISGIHIFTDKKAKILTSIKASFRDAENQIQILNSENFSQQIKGEYFSQSLEEIHATLGDTLYQETAIVLFDDYLSILFEDALLENTIQSAIQYSSLFDKPTFFTFIDEDFLVFGACDKGKLITRRVVGNSCDFDVDEEKINMDYFYFIFKSKNLTNLNDLVNSTDIIYAIEEDYGIFAEISPITIGFFDDKYKLLEKNQTFSVYSVK